MKANYKVLSPYSENISRLLNEKRVLRADSTGLVMLIQGYPGSLLLVMQKLENYRENLLTAGLQISQPVKLGYDPDYKMKLKFYPASEIKEYRYIIFKLKPKNKWDPDFLETIFDFLPAE
jgi:hypothetical protein